MSRVRLMILMLTMLMLTACSESHRSAAVPPPAKLTQDAVAHFCGMLVAGHKGPKGQIFLAGQPQPIWFTSVRDTIAYTLLPEETAEIQVVYVTDMARARSWDSPGPDSWMKAPDALYVIGSSRHGGMGAQEAVPFSSREAAQAFIKDYGGRIVTYDAIPHDYILGDAWGKTETSQ